MVFAKKKEKIIKKFLFTLFFSIPYHLCHNIFLFEFMGHLAGMASNPMEMYLMCVCHNNCMNSGYYNNVVCNKNI